MAESRFVPNRFEAIATARTLVAMSETSGDKASDRPPDRALPGSRLFRREALEHAAQGRDEAHLLQLTPTWTQRAYWLVVVVCGAAMIYAALGQIDEYASGTAILQMEGRIDVTAHLEGTVETVAVRPGQRVDAGQILVRLYAAGELAELRRIDDELELQLVKTLRDPGDTAARNALTALRAQRELALARVDERAICAPQAGLVSDVRVHAGQGLRPGELILSLTGTSAGFRVVALLPGHYRPLLRTGMRLRLELDGYAYAYQTVTIETVSDEAVGPAEIRRYLGPAAADIVQAEGPLVVVEARLPGRSFRARGQLLDYYEGMPARAEVAVRSESILTALVPGLDAFRALGGQHGN